MVMGNGMNHKNKFVHVCQTLALGQLTSGGRAGEEGERRLADGSGGARRRGLVKSDRGMSSEANSYTMLVRLCARQGRRSRSCLAGVSGRREDRRPPTGLSCDGGGRRRRWRRAREWDWRHRLGLRRLQVHGSLMYPFSVGAGGSCVGCCVGEGGGCNYNTNLSLIKIINAN